MTFVVDDKCIDCKHTTCVTVCPVDCCLPDENNVETNDILLKKKQLMHS